MKQHQRRAGSSPIPNRTILHQLEDPEFRDGFVADQVRVRLALLVRSLREQRGWSQAELGRQLGKPQSVVSRLEDPDYGRLSSQTIFEVAAAFGLPVYIDMPNWDEWFRLMEDMSSRNLSRRPFDSEYLATLANDNENIGHAKVARSYIISAAAIAPQQTLMSRVLINTNLLVNYEDKYVNILRGGGTLTSASLLLETITACSTASNAATTLLNETAATALEQLAISVQPANILREEAHV